MSELLSCVEVRAESENPVGSIIWLHGLGADGHDFLPLVPIIDLPNHRFIFPNAPSMPVTINMGAVMPSWYDILTLEDAPERENLEHVMRSADQVRGLIERERERGIPADKILLAGFSQGGAMTIYTGLRYPERLCGLMILSAYLVAPDLLEAEVTEANRETPMLFCHGSYDPLVPLSRGRRAMETIKSLNAGRAITWQEFPMQHEVCTAEILLIKDWLHRCFVDS